MTRYNLNTPTIFLVFDNGKQDWAERMFLTDEAEFYNTAEVDAALAEKDKKIADLKKILKAKKEFVEDINNQLRLELAEKDREIERLTLEKVQDNTLINELREALEE